MIYKHKSFFNKRKAFTLIELLIVIAIIGILFIVLVSKVDFATDKAKATGVQTDFRSFQVAIESVAKEHAGLATFGWDTGDANGNRIRDSYDKGDTNKNGKQDEGEVFVGSKTYGETWTNVYTLTNLADSDDKSAIVALETAINKNLDPKLHITIHDDLTITMANGAQDPWDTEYHGYYITNATVDGKDRGAIVIYSNGANQEWGSEHSIANGVVTVNVPGNNVYGKDDYAIAVVYTYVDGYGEVKTTTSGFSNNQATQGNTSNNSGTGGTEGTEDPDVTELLEPGLYQAGAIELAKAGDVEAAQDMIKTSWEDLLAAGIVHVTNGAVYSNYNSATYENISSDALDGDLVLPNDGSILNISDDAFYECKSLVNVIIPNSVTNIGQMAFDTCSSLRSTVIPDSVITIGQYAFASCENLTNITIGNSVEHIGYDAFAWCSSLTSITIPDSVTSLESCVFYECYNLEKVVLGKGLPYIQEYMFYGCNSLTSIGPIGSGCSIEIPNNITHIGYDAFEDCQGLTNVTIPNSVTNIDDYVFYWCTNITSVVIPDSVINIGSAVFCHCTNLTNIQVSDNNPSYKSIDVSLYSKDGTILIQYNIGNTNTSFIIPSSVTTIGEGAFDGCTNLTSVTIPESVTVIKECAFRDCSQLNAITFNGTSSQWNTISKKDQWKRNVIATYVQCSDGQVTIK